MKSYFKIFINYVILHIKSGMQYKKAFFLQVGGMLLNNSAFIFFWLVLYNKFKISFTQNNIGFKEIMLLWAIASSGFGIAMAIFGGARELSSMIYKGIIDVYLIYPKNPLIMIILSRSSISAWGDILYGYIIFLIFVSTNIISLLIFTFFIILSGIALSSILIILNSLSFYLGNTENLSHQIFNSLIMFATYPENIFSPFVKFLLFTVLPVGFYVYLPVKLINHFDLKIFLFLLSGDIITTILAFFLFFNGLKKYESGNLFFSNK